MLVISKNYEVSLEQYGIQKIKKASRNNRVTVWWHVRVNKVHLTAGLEGLNK